MSEKLDVLIVTQFFPPESMGGAHRWEKLAANLDEDIEPHVLATQPTFPFGEFERRWRLIERETLNGIPVTRLITHQPITDTALGRVLNYGVFSLLSAFYVLVNFWRYDQIVTMSAPHTTFFPGLVGKITGLTWIIDIFDLWIDNAADLGYVEENSLAYWVVSKLEQISIANADTVFVVTETMAEHYKQKYPDTEMDIQIVPFGVDTEQFSPDVSIEEHTEFIYTGNLGTCQAFIPYITAFAELDDGYKLTIVGDGERRQELERLVRELDCDDRVSFIGYVSRDKIPNLLAGADVSIVPLKTKYQLDYARPTKLLETMAVGTPYVASEVEEIANLSDTHSTGKAVQNDSKAIHDAMVTLISDEPTRQVMAKNGVKVVRTQHDWTEIGGQISTIFRNTAKPDSNNESPLDIHG